ncbi:MFS sugar transporter, putative [Aspergillus fumigatus A1163]|uniref:MFS sugar transporter, putative n=1 Tax=Aspergillus fumigatus (strain CBS 144.89 / FGSC A1163 / CEA10) TaxID=451804 RepID=B0YAQ0_ASPFC|nr:MFS sugar transporter, putative [Aspergillus fumigatus A1163]
MASQSPSFLGLSGRALHWAQVALVGAPAFIVFGYNQAGVGPLATLQSWVKTFPQIDTINTTGSLEAHNSTSKGAVIASFQIGALIGALSCTLISDRLGRRKTIFLGSILTIIGEVLQVASYGLVQFVIGRIILGMGVGQYSVAVPVWQSECSSAKNRGQHVIIDGQRAEEATHSLASLKGLPANDEAIRAEISGIESSLELTAQSKGSLMEMFDPNDQERLFYRFCLCIILQFFQQMCGGNLISVYASTIFEQNLGLSASLSKNLAACALTWKFICCFIAFFTIDRLGRRVVFMISGTGMAICMIALAITNSRGTDNKGASIASVVFIFLFNLFYPIGFLGGNFLYCTEVAPVRLRVAMSSISTANHWLWNFVVVMVTPIALDTIGYQYYVMYAVLSACIPLLVYFFYPETMNRNLELLNHVFRDASSPWKIVSMANHLPQGEVTEADLMEMNKKGDGCSVEMAEKV